MSDRQPPTAIQGVLADRVDGEPPAILGLTTSELLMVALITGLVLLPLLLAIAFVINVVSTVLMATGFIFLGGVYCGALILRRLKRGRPMGHYQVRFAVLMQRLFGGRAFLLRAGPWSISRTRAPAPRRKG